MDTDKLKAVPDALANLSNVVKNDLVKKTDYNTLKSKVDGIDTSIVTRTKFTAYTNSLDEKLIKLKKGFLFQLIFLRLLVLIMKKIC